MSELFLQIIKQLVAAMAAMLTPEQVKSILDKAFDAIEEKVKDSKSQWDDVIVLPIVEAIRRALGVEDNDE